MLRVCLRGVLKEGVMRGDVVRLHCGGVFECVYVDRVC